MGCNYVFEEALGRRFSLARRKFGMVRFIQYDARDGRTVFRGHGNATTDIFLPFTPKEEDEMVDCCIDPPEMDCPQSSICEGNELIYEFCSGHKRDARPGGSESTCFLQTNASEDYRRDCNFDDMEYSYVINFNHSQEKNMDRIVSPEENNGTETTKSFIPVDIGKSYLNEAVAYYKSLFGRLPNEYYASDFSDFDKKLNIKKSMENVEKTLKIKQRLLYKCCDVNTKKTVIREVNYVTEDGLLLFLSDPFNAIITFYDRPEQLNELLPLIKATKNKKTPERPKFKLLVHSQYGFSTEEFDLKSFDVNVNDNYNDDIPDDKIRDFINAEGEAGLCILHGTPGTGKTYYIRDLIKNCTREFIYMNKECLNYINDSSFIAFLVRSKNSVFIMEDCENVLASRTEYNNTISTLLNLSDGLLGDSLNNKFICTFNTDISNIDEALLRKGRMKVCYEFKYLDKDKANKLAEKLHKKDRFDKDTPLCDVMNSESNGSEDIPFKKKVEKIGF